MKEVAKINGEILSDADGMTLSEYMAKAGFRPDRVAIEYNGEILPKASYDTTVIASSDSVEIVEFMGGG